MSPTAPAALLARTREIDPPTDLLDRLGDDGFAWLDGAGGLVTAGVVARVPTSQTTEVLRSIGVDDPLARPGTGAIAVGALPFAGAGELVVPQTVTAVAADGTAWHTEIGPAEATEPDGAERSRPSVFTVGSVQSREEWQRMVEAVLTAIDEGRLLKAVLAREVTVEADAPFDARAVLNRLRATQAGSVAYGFLDGPRTLVGATPELLVRRQGTLVLSRPMAGTMARRSSSAEDDRVATALAASAKDDNEHRLVVDAVLDTLTPWCDDLRADFPPDVVRLPALMHLATAVRGRLREPAPTALELAAALHPTPAVGGTPRVEALPLIERLEGFERGRYAGPVGWVDARGDGTWGVALRGAEIDGNRARLVSGAGIVAGSDPEAEWRETEVKLEPMLRVLVRP
ncbi:MAG TPA: isochorismate synthase [Acidimicrobiia bacterium]|nr:isochorismate synthase [Acidimicrobiia bacterium]